MADKSTKNSPPGGGNAVLTDKASEILIKTAGWMREHPDEEDLAKGGLDLLLAASLAKYYGAYYDRKTRMDLGLPGEGKPPLSVPGGEKPPASVPGGEKPPASVPSGAEPPMSELGGLEAPRPGRPLTRFEESLANDMSYVNEWSMPSGVRPGGAAARQAGANIGALIAEEGAPAAESASWLAKTFPKISGGVETATSWVDRGVSWATETALPYVKTIPGGATAMELAGSALPYMRWAFRAAPMVQTVLTAREAAKAIQSQSARANRAFEQRDRIYAGLSNDNPALRFEDVLKQRAVDGQWSPDVMKHLRHFSNSTGDSSDIPTGGMDLGVWNPMAAPRYWVDWARSEDPNKIPSGMFGFLDPDAALRIGGDYLYDKFCRPKLGPLPPPRKLPVMSAVEGPMGPPLPPPGWARPPREDPYANWNLNVGNAEQLGYPPTASLSRRERYRNVMAEAANEGFSDTAAGPPFIVPPAYPAPSPEQFRAAPAVSAPAAPAASRPSSFVPIGASFAAPSSTDAAIAELRELMRSEFAKLNGTLRIYFNCFPPSSLNTRGNYEMDQRR